jgi:hydroxymethylbilane synthase
VHSFKDVPTRIPDGLALAAVMEREDPRDAFLPAPGRARTLADLPAGSRIGTSSLRRRALLLAARSDFVIDDLRGNLDTRLRKLEDGSYDAIILALAGLRRFGREQAVGETLGQPHWLPAAGQGALALVARADDQQTLARLSALDHAPTRAATAAERAFLAALEGGCQIPIGALGTTRDQQIELHGLVASLDGRTVVRGHIEGRSDDAARLGGELARQLSERGADQILRAVRGAHADVPRPQAP